MNPLIKITAFSLAEVTLIFAALIIAATMIGAIHW